MHATLLKIWRRLQGSFWFLPSLMGLGSALLAVALVMLDEIYANAWLRTQPWARGWVYGGDAEGASDVLGIIAGSMIAMAGVVFSMTLVALSLASAQFGPRLLRNFMRDRVNQAVLGTFISTFLYSLLALALRTRSFIQVLYRPGRYAISDTPLVSVWPAAVVDDDFVEEARAAFVFGNQRTAAQDLEFPVDQLVEVAVRALSPGVNDPFTAVNCVDRLGSALTRLARVELASTDERDSEGKVRVALPAICFADVLDASINPIRQCAQASMPVSIRMLEVLQLVAAAASREEDREAVGRQAMMIARGAGVGLMESEDRDAVEGCLQRVLVNVHPDLAGESAGMATGDAMNAPDRNG